jgi:hypothetical protein
MSQYFFTSIKSDKNIIKLYIRKNNLLIDKIGIIKKKNKDFQVILSEKKLHFWLNKIIFLNTFEDNLIDNYLKCKFLDYKK